MTPVVPNGGLTRRQLMAAAGGAVVLLGLEACGGGGTSFDHRTFGLSVSAPPAEIVGEALKVGKVLGRKPGIVNSYVAWHWDAPFPDKFVRDASDAGVVPQITWEPWDPTTKTPADQPKYRHAALAGFDAYIERFAQGAAEAGLPFNMRFAHEMNGWWYPWAVGTNDNSAADYVRSWRRMHRVFEDAGATQTSWTWSVNTVAAAQPGKQPVDIAECYPGDDFVDLVSLDVYDFDGTLSPEQVVGTSLDKLAAVAPGKPVWVNEIGTARASGRADWVAECVAFLRTTPVEALVWFDIAPPGQPDFRISTPDPTASAVRTALEKW